MLTADGPRVLEFNVRFGDPETQAVLPRLRSDLLDLLQRCARGGGLADAPAVDWDPRTAVTLVLAAPGYPGGAADGQPDRGARGRGRDRRRGDARGHRRRAGATGGDVVTAGGRVLNVTALGDGPADARAAAYAAADLITFEGRQLRRDIALRAVEHPA